MNVCVKYKMVTKDKSKEIDIKSRMCFYFDDIIPDGNIYSVYILLGEKIYENISVYDILYKTSMGPKSLLLGSIK